MSPRDYFSGDETKKDKDGKIHEVTQQGVGICINNELLNHIIEIEPINERLMYITIGHALPITFICNYTPHSYSTITRKRKPLQKTGGNPEEKTIARTNIYSRRFQRPPTTKNEQT